MKATGLNRKDRVSTQVHRELADLLGREYGDPRIRALTVADVEVSRDLRNAKVFVTVTDGANSEDCLRAVRKAAGDIRRKLGARLRMKYLPVLRFEHDTSLDRAFELDRLIKVGLSPSAASQSDDVPEPAKAGASHEQSR